MVGYITKDGIKKILELIHKNSGGSGGITLPINTWELASCNEPNIVKQSEGVWYIPRMVLNSSVFTFTIEVPSPMIFEFTFNADKTSSSIFPLVQVMTNDDSTYSLSIDTVSSRISGSRAFSLSAGTNTFSVVISDGYRLSVSNIILSLTPIG